MLQRTILLLLFCVSSTVWAEPATPFDTRNQNPLVLIYGLPAPTPAHIAPKGEWRTSVSLDAANMINIDTPDNEALLIDGEIHQYRYSLEYGINDRWSLSADIPYLRHSGGSLDQPIEEYHDLLNLNPGYRPDNPRDRLMYFYRRDGIERLNVTRDRSGPGDVQLAAARRVVSTDATDLSLWTGLKLPTGDPDELTGSGGADLSVWGAARHAVTAAWQLYGTTGIVAIGEGDVLGDMQADAVIFGSAGTQWNMYPNVALKAQLEWHSSFYESTNSRFLSDVLQFTFGGTVKAGDNAFVDIAIVEDIKEDASPDVNFHLSLRIEH